MSQTSSKYIGLVLLTILFAVQFIFVNPIGEFALNDDWVHTDTIKHWTQTGEFRLMPYAGPTFYVPILYGSAITNIFGFSFSNLRISTLVFALGAIIFFYLFLHKVTKRTGLALLGTLTLWFNPMFYNLSFTFMTDIPALFFIIASLYYYYLAFKTGKTKYLVFGSILSILGTFTRQTNILTLAAAGLYSLKYFKTFKLKGLLIGFGIPLAVAGVIYTYLNIYELLPQSTGTHFIEGFGRTLGHIKWWLFYIPIYLGVFLLPLTFGWLRAHKGDFWSRGFWMFFIPLVVLVVFIRQAYGLQFPYIGNIINTHGLGPMRTVLAGNLTPLIPSWAWAVLTIISAAALALLIRFYKYTSKPGTPLNFLYLFAVLYTLPLLIFESFDRYLLPLIAVFIIFVLQKTKQQKYSTISAITLIVIMAFISISQTDHYLSWNKARWQLANYQLSKNTPIDHIDGGYEWDGWHTYWSTLESGNTEGPDSAPWWIRTMFVNNTEEYIISFSPIKNYEVVHRIDLNTLNPNNSIFLLNKIDY